MHIWRISEFADLSGEGGVAYPGRWNERGVPIVYCADHPSTALLEILVHLRAANMPETYQLIAIAVPDTLEISVATPPERWLDAPAATQHIWTNFVGASKGALLRVPSVVMPQASNYLLNPGHADAEGIRIVETWRYPFDSRFLG